MSDKNAARLLGQLKGLPTNAADLWKLHAIHVCTEFCVKSLATPQTTDKVVDNE